VNSRTRFTDPEAVETWDAQFRWRDHGRLRDVTVDQTWARVATAVAAAEGVSGQRWAERFVEAFRNWWLLPDVRLLRHAGTDEAPLPLREPVAVLNAAAFTARTLASPPEFHRAHCLEIAALAVRLLDDALLASAAPGDAEAGVRIGLVGLDDALAALGAGAGAETAVAADAARGIAQALAEGCLRGAVALAIERGPRLRPDADWLARWRARGLPADLLEQAARHGVRFDALTACDPQPLLARLANGVSDGTPAGFAEGEDPARAPVADALRPYFDRPGARRTNGLDHAEEILS
jgi:ribonucleoside-diphosphate reductase alpha chain